MSSPFTLLQGKQGVQGAYALVRGGSNTGVYTTRVCAEGLHFSAFHFTSVFYGNSLNKIFTVHKDCTFHFLFLVNTYTFNANMARYSLSVCVIITTALHLETGI